MMEVYRFFKPEARHPTKGPALDHAHGDYLRKAASQGDAEWAQKCINSGVPADPNNAAHTSALQVALAEGQLEVAKLLIGSGADVNRVAGNSTPLMEAAAAGSLEAVQHLLENKANPALSVEGTTAVHMAAKHGHADILSLLLEQPGMGPEMVTTPNAQGKTPMHMAASQTLGNEGVAELLAARGASVAVADGSGATPLHAAALVGNMGLVRWMVEGGAPGSGAALAGVQDARGRTPLHLAAQFGRIEAADYLAFKAGSAAVVAADVDGCTALHCAAKSLMATQAGQQQLVQALLGMGADPAAKDKAGQRAGDYASSPALKDLLAPASTSTAAAPAEPAAIEAKTVMVELAPIKGASNKGERMAAALSQALASSSGDAGASEPTAPASPTAWVAKEAMRRHTSEAGGAGDNWKLSTVPEPVEQ